MRAWSALALIPLAVVLACSGKTTSSGGSGGSAAAAGRGAGGASAGVGGTAAPSGGSAGSQVGAGSGGASGSATTGGHGGSSASATGGDGAMSGGGSGNAGGTSNAGSGTGASGAGGSGAGTGGAGGTSGAGDAGAAGEPPSSCIQNTDCAVIPLSCCGSCGAATRGDAQALSLDDVDAFWKGDCGNTACPACAGQTDPTLIASCQGGFCTLIDLLEHELTECSTPDDCRVRTSACCECGGENEPLIAVNPDSPVSYETLICPGGGLCAQCEPMYPPTTIDCENRHCKVAP